MQIGNSSKDIWQGAGAMIAQYGEHAVIEAAKMADHYLEIGDIDRQKTWQRVMLAIAEMNEVDGRPAN